MNEENKLGSQPVGGLLLSLAVPAVLAQIVSILYNLVDRIFIGQRCGNFAMAAIGISTPIITIITAFTGLFGTGGAPLCSIKMGQKKEAEAEKIMGSCFFSILATAVILTITILIFLKPLLSMFGASQVTIGDASSYLGIYVWGTIFVMITVGMNPFINTQGFAKIGMATTLIGAILNIFLDAILIIGLNMGVAGAAIATVISQGVSAVWVLHFLFGKKTLLHLRLPYIRWNFSIMKPVLALGASPFFMTSTEGLLMISFNTQLLLFGGDIAVSAMTILNSMFMFIVLPSQGIAMGAQPILSYNYGAGKMDRVRKTYKMTLCLCGGVTAVSTLSMLLIPEIFVGIFAKDSALIEIAAQMLSIYVIGGLVMGANNTYQQCYTALGQAKYSFAFAFFRKIVVLIPCIYILPRLFPNLSIPGFALTGSVLAIILSEPISDISTTLLNTIFFRKFYKTKLSNEAMSEYMP